MKKRDNNIDTIEDILTDIAINESYNNLILEYLDKNYMRDKDISDKEALTSYYHEKEYNKQAYINLVDDIQRRNKDIKDKLTIILKDLMK